VTCDNAAQSTREPLPALAGPPYAIRQTCSGRTTRARARDRMPQKFSDHRAHERQDDGITCTFVSAEPRGIAAGHQQRNHQHPQCPCPPPCSCHVADDMLSAEAGEADPTPGPSPRAAKPSVPAIVAPARIFFRYIMQPLMQSSLYRYPLLSMGGRCHERVTEDRPTTAPLRDDVARRPPH
jgi:hypothetical protein